MYIILYFFCVLLVIFALFIGYRLRLFEKPLESPEEIKKFSVDVVFRQIESVSIENKYDCNAKSLRVCSMNDPTTLFGCRELTVRCQHFNKDTEFKEHGKTFEIPKNKSVNEGYALSITNLAEACNPYHGDLVLVTANSDSNEYMLICSCKNPGFIGNTSLLDACEEVFICDGKIDDLNKPLNEINCKCNADEMTVRYNTGAPVCKPMLVHEANAIYADWSSYVDWVSDRKINKDVFNKTIQQNLKTSVLLNPCTSSAHDLSVPIPNSKYSTLTRTCNYADYGLPIRTGVLDEPAKKYERVDGGLITGRYHFLRISGGNSGVTSFGAVRAPMTFDNTEQEADMVLPHSITTGGTMSQIKIDLSKPISGWGPKCETRSGYKWNCYVRNAPKWYSQGIPRLGFSDLPTFWSQRELWNWTETVFNDAFPIDANGVSVDNKRLNDFDGKGFKTNGYGLKLNPSGDSGMLSFRNFNDWEVHRNTIT